MRENVVIWENGDLAVWESPHGVVKCRILGTYRDNVVIQVTARKNRYIAARRIIAVSPDRVHHRQNVYLREGFWRVCCPRVVNWDNVEPYAGNISDLRFY